MSDDQGQQQKNILVTGATGFIGMALLSALRTDGWQITALVRDYARARTQLGPEVRLVRSLTELGVDTRIEVIINLAGEGIAAQRWSKTRKKQLLDSRLQTTREVVQLIQRLHHKPLQLLSASATGFYGDRGDVPLTEESSSGEGFSHELCKRWEQASRKAEAEGVPVTLLRFGVVLGAEGGMLARLLPVYRLGLGGRIGNGRQYLSWIHRDDAVAAILWLLHNPLPGIVNVTAPGAVTNQEFSRQLATQLKRPAVFTQPAFVVRALFGEMGQELLLGGSNVVPERLLHHGFSYQYPEIESALAAELRP